MGYSLTPLRHESKKPALSMFSHFTSRKPSLKEEMELASYATTSYGLLVGRPHGIVVLDLNEDDALAQVPKAELPRTVCVKTVRGHHYYFRHPGVPLRRKTPVLAKADLKSSGYVVIAGSTHPTGAKYEYVTSPDETEIAECPSWIVELYGANDPLPLNFTFMEFLLCGLPEAPEARKNALIEEARQIRNDVLTGLIGIDDAVDMLMDGSTLDYDEAMHTIINA